MLGRLFRKSPGVIAMKERPSSLVRRLDPKLEELIRALARKAAREDHEADRKTVVAESVRKD